MLISSIAVIYGGGQIPIANYLMGLLIETLLGLNFKVYGVKRSFWGLALKENYELMTLEKSRYIKNKLGTYFEMCRKVDPANDIWFHQILDNLKKLNIHFILLCGGDGSLRAAREFEEKCKLSGYQIKIIYIPCTIDGMNGTEALGVSSAVKESVREILLTSINAFSTWDNGYSIPRVAISEVQGRNRNDILVKSMNYFINNGFEYYSLKEINIICIPAGHVWNVESVISKINSKPTTIICAEGACPTDFYWNLIPGNSIGQKLQKLLEAANIKANLREVSYLSQTNDCIQDEDKKEVDDFVSMAISNLSVDNSIAIVKNGIFKTSTLQDLAEKNPNSTQVQLDCGEIELLKDFLP